MIYIQADLDTFKALLMTYEAAYDSMLEYMTSKQSVCDWTAVATAAADIRELQGKIEVLRYVIRTVKESLQFNQKQSISSVTSGSGYTGLSVKSEGKGTTGNPTGNTRPGAQGQRRSN